MIVCNLSIVLLILDYEIFQAAEGFINLYGIDYSRKAIDLAQKAAVQKDMKVTYKVSFQQLCIYFPFLDGCINYFLTQCTLLYFFCDLLESYLIRYLFFETSPNHGCGQFTASHTFNPYMYSCPISLIL